MKLQLSISLLASDRADSLERCLDSLRELMIKVPSELIIVFTGKDPKVLEIAKRYTDKIIPFTWCDDFSAARNVGLREAKGEWFLYLDDDEWFEDTDAIVDFFTTGEYRLYSSAMYCQRNYLNWNATKYSDFYAYRMNQRVPNLHFENPIHEELVPCEFQFKKLESYVHHYGYVNKTKSKEADKPARNIPMLLADIEKRPEYIKNYMQIVNEYFIEKKWDEAVAYCEKGKKLCKRRELSSLRGWFSAHLAQALFKKDDKLYAEKKIKEMLEREQLSEVVKLVLYNVLQCLYIAQNMPEESLKYGLKFEEILAFLDRNPKLWEEQSVMTITEDDIKAKEKLYPGRLNSALAALDLQDWENAKYFLSLLPWNEEYQIREYYERLDKWKEKYGADLQKIFCELPFDSPYLLLQRILAACEQENSEELKDLFAKGMEKIDFPYLQYQLIKTGLQYHMDLSSLAKRMDLQSWEVCISKVAAHLTLKELEEIKPSMELLLEKARVQGLWLKKLILEKELLQGGFMKAKIYSGLRAYSQCVVDFYKMQYRDEIFERENRLILSEECRFALLALEALDDMEKGEMAKAVRAFRDALRIYPNMTSVVNEIIRYLKQDMNHPPVNAGTEFEQLAVQMKEALRGMIQAGQYEQASPVVEQLLPLLPEDLELLKMRQAILSR